MSDKVKIDITDCPCGKTGPHEHGRAQHDRLVDRAGDRCSLAGPPQGGPLRRLLGRERS